jgi:hypothetical protein
MGKYEKRRPLGEFRQMWEGYVARYLTQTEWEDVDWINLDQDMGMWEILVNMVLNIWVP